MEAAAAAYNEEEMGFLNPWIVTGWAYSGGSLRHTTVSGRMRIVVTETYLRVGLYSPSWWKAQRPYITVRMHSDGGAYATLSPGAELVAWSPARLHPLWYYLEPSMGALIYKPLLQEMVLRARSEEQSSRQGQGLPYREPQFPTERRSVPYERDMERRLYGARWSV